MQCNKLGTERYDDFISWKSETDTPIPSVAVLRNRLVVSDLSMIKRTFLEVRNYIFHFSINSRIKLCVFLHEVRIAISRLLLVLNLSDNALLIRFITKIILFSFKYL